MREEKTADLPKMNAWLFRFAAIFVILTLPLTACESSASTGPEATDQRLSTPILPSETSVTSQNSTPTNTAATSSTTVSATITPEATSTLQIRRLHMIDTKIGWAEDTESRILHTIQGIQAWKNVSPPYPEGEFGTAAFFFDGDTTFLVTTQMIPSSEELKAQIVPWTTTDGGQTWQESETVSFQAHGPFFPTQLYLLSEKHGWLLTQEFMGMGTCGASILETSDGGFHYDLIYQTFTGPSNDPGMLYGTCMLSFGREIMSFVSDSTAFASSNYEQLVVSQDGGRTWQPLELEQPSDYPHPASPVNVISAPLFSSDRDGVLSVRVYDESQRAEPPYAVFHGLPQAQYLYYTHDAGQTWFPRPAPAKIGTVSFLNSSIGWFLGRDATTPSGGTQLYVTGDGGESWSPISLDTLLPLGTEIQFIDEKIGFAYNPYTGYDSNPYNELDSRSGVESYVFVSEDGGRSWLPVEPHLGH